MFPKTTQMPSTKIIVSAAASAAATAMLIRTIAKDFLPRELRDYIFSKIKTLITSFSSELTIVMDEYEGLNHNHLFKAAEVYLEPIIPPNTKRIKATQVRKARNISLSLEKNEEIFDNFNGVQLKWKYLSKKEPRYIPSPDGYSSVRKSELGSFELSFHKKHKEMVVETYLPHVLNKAKELKEKKKLLKLHTLSQDRVIGKRGDVWQSVNLDHPATFETLAMDLELKRMIMEDLERFVKRKEYYRRVGKAWKRGYLLFGPPGTGKSSLIAAMANYLSFDIYDLELTELRGNNELRKLLISTGNKSILVVEDIDCTIELQNRLAEARVKHPNRYNSGSSEVTLSGLLNFIDGLWSSCGDERVIVFTTNHKEKLDPALLRPGRMDMHIHMSYCTPCGFKMLASNYLGIAEHSLFSEIDELIVTTKVTPAEVGEQLMKDEETETVLGGLIEFLEGKKKENEESKAKKEELEAAEGAESTQKVEEKGGNEKQVGKGKQGTLKIQ